MSNTSKTDTLTANGNRRQVARTERLGDGLYLAYLPGGARSFRYDYRFKAPGAAKAVYKTKVYGQMSDLMGVTEARELHKVFRAELAKPDAVDPSAMVTILRDQRAGKFEAICKQWNAERVEEKLISEMQAERILEVMDLHVFPVIGEMSLGKITTPILYSMCVDIFRQSPSVPQVVRCWLRMVFKYGQNRQLCEANPAADLEIKKHRAARFDRIGADRLPLFFRDLHEYAKRPRTDEATVLGLRLMVHFAVRVSTMCSLRFSHVTDVEVEIEEGKYQTVPMILVPPEHMKDADRLTKPKRGDFRIPLTPATREIIERLRELAGGSDFMFPHRTEIGETISGQTFLMALKRMGWNGKGEHLTADYRPNATVHGFRSTFKTYAGQKWAETERENHALDFQMDHVNDDEVDAAYKRDDDDSHRGLLLPERIELMTWWSKIVAEREEQRYTAKVLPFKRAA
jgi:integrase